MHKINFRNSIKSESNQSWFNYSDVITNVIEKEKFSMASKHTDERMGVL